jgi:drug/metabolite transporter (DMT)-like permease
MGESVDHGGTARVTADLALLLVAVIWGSAFSAQRVAAAHIGPFLYNGIRFLLAAGALALVTRKSWRSMGRREWLGGLVAGTILAAASVLQQAGLAYTTAGKAGFITGLYVVIVPVVTSIVWRLRPHWTVWVASLIATLGLFLLSVQGVWTLAIGDALELVGAGLWACHVIAIDRLAKGSHPLHISLAQCLVAGAWSTGLGMAIEAQTLAGLPAAWWAVAYGGLISVGVAYTLQVYGQRHTTPSDAAIILSMESVFAALFGWLFLHEVLTWVQFVGCVLMFAGMLLAQGFSLLRARTPRDVSDHAGGGAVRKRSVSARE